MKALLIAGFGILMATSAVAQIPQYNSGGYRQDGTYVQPHYTTKPDGNIWNNYSTQGNVNPYTGRAGTVDPYRVQTPSQPSYNNYGFGSGSTNRRR
jgi:hypothetical protein